MSDWGHSVKRPYLGDHTAEDFQRYTDIGGDASKAARRSAIENSLGNLGESIDGLGMGPGLGFEQTANFTNQQRMIYGLQNRGMDRNLMNRYRTAEDARIFSDIGSIAAANRSASRSRGRSGFNPALMSRTVGARLALGAEQNREAAMKQAEMNEAIRFQNLGVAAGLQGQLTSAGLSREAAMNQFALQSRAQEFGERVSQTEMLQALAQLRIQQDVGYRGAGAQGKMAAAQAQTGRYNMCGGLGQGTGSVAASFITGGFGMAPPVQPGA